jgi:hypothetical protein
MHIKRLCTDLRKIRSCSLPNSKLGTLAYSEGPRAAKAKGTVTQAERLSR